MDKSATNILETSSARAQQEAAEREESLSDPFVAISTDPFDAQISETITSVVTAPSRSNVKSGEGSYQNFDALARPVSKKQRPLSSLIWSDDYDSSRSNLYSYDSTLEHKIRNGVSQTIAPPPRWHLDTGAREPGTLNSFRDRPLPAKMEEYRKRKQVLSAAVTRSPLLAFVEFSGRSGMDRLLLFHNAMRSELFSLYAISSSMEKRALDVNENDAESFYTWIGLFGDFVRLYFCASERYVFHTIESTCDMELKERLVRKNRCQAKLEIVFKLEALEGLKRRMNATSRNCSEVVQLLSKHVDSFALSLLQYLDAEIEQVPTILTSYFHEERILEMFQSIDDYILESANGQMLQVILSHGSHRDLKHQKRWLHQHIHRVYRHKTKLQTSVVTQKHLQRFYETHQRHVRGFLKAESEYAKLFA